MEIGKKIRRLRLQRGLTQEELADRCELSKGFISLLERDLTSPSIATLMDILESLGSDLRSFFSGDGRRKARVRRGDTSSSRRTPRASAGHPLAGAVGAEKTRWSVHARARPAARPREDDPHEGEEFGYVLSGALKIVLGDRVERVKRDESFYFARPRRTAGQRRQVALPRAVGFHAAVVLTN